MAKPRGWPGGLGRLEGLLPLKVSISSTRQQLLEPPHLILKRVKRLWEELYRLVQGARKLARDTLHYKKNLLYYGGHRE